MANQRTTALIGINEVGAIVGGTDVPWGETEQAGATLTLDGTDFELRSAQSKMLRDRIAITRDAQVTVRLQNVDLANIRDVLGLPASALTGDLHGTTPTDEVLSIDPEQISTEEFGLYIETPGPAGPRRIEIARCKPHGTLTLNFSATENQRLEATFQVLRPEGGAPAIKITDAV